MSPRQILNYNENPAVMDDGRKPAPRYTMYRSRHERHAVPTTFADERPNVRQANELEQVETLNKRGGKVLHAVALHAQWRFLLVTFLCRQRKVTIKKFNRSERAKIIDDNRHV